MLPNGESSACSLHLQQTGAAGLGTEQLLCSVSKHPPWTQLVLPRDPSLPWHSAEQANTRPQLRHSFLVLQHKPSMPAAHRPLPHPCVEASQCSECLLTNEEFGNLECKGGEGNTRIPAFRIQP